MERRIPFPRNSASPRTVQNGFRHEDLPPDAAAGPDFSTCRHRKGMTQDSPTHVCSDHGHGSTAGRPLPPQRRQHRASIPHPQGSACSGRPLSHHTGRSRLRQTSLCACLSAPAKSTSGSSRTGTIRPPSAALRPSTPDRNPIRKKKEGRIKGSGPHSIISAIRRAFLYL